MSRHYNDFEFDEENMGDDLYYGDITSADGDYAWSEMDELAEIESIFDKK